jgi:Lhr-like helicase
LANQFTKGTRKQHDETTKDKIRAEALSNRLYKFAKATPKRREKLDMTPAQVAAAKVVIERGKPALQAIQQTVREEPGNPEEMKAQLLALLSENLALLADLPPAVRSDAMSVLGLDRGAVATEGPEKPH